MPRVLSDWDQTAKGDLISFGIETPRFSFRVNDTSMLEAIR
jgi:hypothetical protein